MFYEFENESTKDKNILRVVNESFIGRVDRSYRKSGYFYVEVLADKRELELMKFVGKNLKSIKLVSSYKIVS